MKHFLGITLTALIASVSANLSAADVATRGDGTVWTLQKLAAEPGMGVEQRGDTFTLANTLVIAHGDGLRLTPGTVVRMGQSVSLQVEGRAEFDMPAQGRVLFTRSADGVVPGVVMLESEEETTTVRNVDFEYVGLKNFSPSGLRVDSCTFRRHAASSGNGSSALQLGVNGAAFTVTNCIFERNERAAIGGAANYSNPLTVENCQFLYNGTSDRQYPQLNLTAASQVTIRNCVVIGDPTKTRVGGIVVADLLDMVPDARLLVEGCVVKDARFGIAVYSGQTAELRNNVLIDNNAETNPNNGGSGINIYDTTGRQHTTMSGNVIAGCLWGVTVVATKPGTVANLGRIDVDPMDSEYNVGRNVFYGNGNNGAVYDLYNNSANTVYAQNNFWLTAATFGTDGIDSCIVDKNDNAALGEVVYRLPGGHTPVASAGAIPRLPASLSAVYNLRGVRTDALRPGLNIVRENSGITRKVMK